MKLLFASDSFKGTLSSEKTIELLTKAAHDVFVLALPLCVERDPDELVELRVVRRRSMVRFMETAFAREPNRFIRSHRPASAAHETLGIRPRRNEEVDARTRHDALVPEMPAAVGAPARELEDIPEEDADLLTLGDMGFGERRELDDSIGDQ